MAHDVVVVGGGVVGCAIAYHLLGLEPALDVAVVERDPTYEFASTTRSDGNVRVQFNLEENIAMSMYAMEVLETFAEDFAVGEYRPEPSCRRQGNLFTVDEAQVPAALAGLETQRRMGCDVRWMSAAGIAEAYPVYAPHGLIGGTYGPRDGAVDPSAVLFGYRRTAAAMGARFVQAQVTGLLVAENGIGGVTLATGEKVAAPVVVNAAGAWAAELAETAGVDLPVEPVVRSVFVVETDRDWGESLPSIFLPSGAYVLSEGGRRFLMAWSRPEDPVGYNLRHHRSDFYDVVWPEIVAHLPNLDRVRVVGGWAGLYAVNTFDGNAILGQWPEVEGLYLANGFTGHGFQQCHAVGRHLAEMILDHPPSLDLARFGPLRILRNEPVFEHAARII